MKKNSGENSVQKPKTSRVAIASLVLAILSPVTCYITAVPAIILGIVSLVKISQSKGQLKGMGLAVTGVALPVVILPFVAVVFLTGMFFPSLAHTRQLAFRAQCTGNLKQISFMMHMYANDHNDQFPDPDKWCDLLFEQAGATPLIFHCNASATPLDTCNYAMNKNLENFSRGDAPPDMVAIFEIQPGWNQVGGPEILTTDNHQGDGCNVLYVDGHVEFVRMRDLDKLKW